MVKKKLIISSGILSIIICICVLVLYFVLSIYLPCSNIGGSKELVVAKGEGVNQISRKLKKEGLICNSFVFETYVWLLNKEDEFKAGIHYLPKNASMISLINLLTSGRSLSNEITIKILEGWTNQEIADYLASVKVVSSEEFLATAKLNNNNYQFDFLPTSGKIQTLEGYLFPDTYRIFRNTSAQEIINKMLENFDKKLSRELRQEIDRQNKAIHQILIMASILEEEAMSDQDRAKIADIFWRRIDSKMPLQADSTVNYITGKKDPAVSYQDLGIEDPYNTYKYKGLPPGPISNPGLAAIRSAIYPEKNNFWYFLSNKDGKIIYSKTYEEHVANKATYLK